MEKCASCNKEFKTEESMWQHCDAVHRQKNVDKEVFECIAGDLPDGAYWAMADEFGLGPEDFI